MPRYQEDDYGDRRGVHRRRISRRGSNTPIIIGTIVIGAALVGVVLASMLIRKDDPAEMKQRVRVAATRFLEAAHQGDADRIFDQINVEGAKGWVIRRLGVKLSKKYRSWDTWEDREEAARWRREQDQRILAEIRGLPKKLALDDLASIEQSVKDAKVRLEMNTAKLTLQHRNGVAEIYLQEEKNGQWVTVYWELLRNASGR